MAMECVRRLQVYRNRIAGPSEADNYPIQSSFLIEGPECDGLLLFAPRKTDDLRPAFFGQYPNTVIFLQTLIDPAIGCHCLNRTFTDTDALRAFAHLGDRDFIYFLDENGTTFLQANKMYVCRLAKHGG